MIEMLAMFVDGSADLKVMVFGPSWTWSRGTGIEMLDQANVVHPVGHAVSIQGPPLMLIEGTIGANEYVLSTTCAPVGV